MGRDSLALRRVAERDCELVFSWANDPVARSMSMSVEPIPRDAHERWFAAKLCDPACLFWIATRPEGEAIAQVRLDVEQDGRAVISVSVAPEWRGRGYGAEVIRLATIEALQAGGVESIHAYLKPENVASARAFARAGFSPPVPVLYEGASALHMSLVPHERRSCDPAV